MDGPWQDYQTASAAPVPAGPWADYQTPSPAAAPAASQATPEFGSDDYVKAMAAKHDVDPDYVRGIVNSQTQGEALKGTPILGAFVDKAGAYAGAAAHALTGAGAAGDTVSDRATKNLALNQEIASDFEQAHPALSTASNVIGGVLTTAPAAATSVGARLLGLTGTTLPRMIAQGAAAGAGLGAADTALRGGDAGTGAAIGGITGAAGPVVGRVLGNAIQGARNVIAGPRVAAPANVVPLAGVDVPISGGQATGDVATQMMEQNALRGGEGQAPQRVAGQFFNDEQAPAIEQARANIGRNLDSAGQVIADNPQDAAELAANSVRNAADASKQNYQDLYKTAFSLPGEFDASTFKGIGSKIKDDLTNNTQSPVIIDDVTTPIASKAIRDIDNNISQLRIQNRADPQGPPGPTTETKTILSGPGYHIADDIEHPPNITGVNLQGVDQVRKQLVAMAQATERGGADRRAMSRIIGGFDNHVEGAINDGLFTGDDAALDAIREARSAYSQHQQQFRSQGAGDDVGRAMEKIIGRNGADGATPTEVANYLYGQAKVGGTGLSVRLAQRMQNILGSDSPEWSAIRQGLWSRLSEATEGATQFGSQKANNRISEFLNGSGKPLSQVMFSGQERDLMNRYAMLQRQITPLPGTVNHSNTAPVLRMIAGNTLRGLSVLLGDVAAGPVGAVAGLGANAATKAIAERSAAGRVARSLYQSPQQNAQSRAFANQMARYGAVGSRLLAGPMDQKQAVNQ